MNDFNLKQKLVVLVMDLMLLAELGYSIYLGVTTGGDVTLVFLKNFVPAVILTVIGSRWLIRRWQTVAVPSTDAQTLAPSPPRI
jgi:hypothetical protein